MLNCKNLLVTGGSGFIGSNFLKIMLPKYPDTNFINLDSLTYASNSDNTLGFNRFSNYLFYKADINDSVFVSKLFKDHKIDSVINFAAESHVDNSIADPELFIKTNILGTHNLLQISYKNWMKGPFDLKSEYVNAKFLQISTDEVYGSIDTGSFSESSPYSPNSPYSASKASADLIVKSYNSTYGLNTLITLSSNNYGPGQHKEKFIPTIINCLIKNIEIPIYGNGKNIRDWIHVDENCRAIEFIFNKGVIGESYNIGVENELTNLELVKKIFKAYSSSQKNPHNELRIKFVEDRFGHDFRYYLNNSKLKSLGWNYDDQSDNLLLKLVDYYILKA